MLLALCLLLIAPRVCAEDAIIEHLQLTQTSITQVLQILADASDWTVIPSREVTGQISVYLRNVSAGVALEKILHNNGFRYVRDGNTITVMTKEQFEQEYGSELERRIYPLEFAKASEAAGMVQQALSPGARALPDPRGNQLIIEEHSSRMGSIDQLVDDLDKRQETRVVALRHAWVRDLRSAVISMMGDPRHLIADERTNRFLLTGTTDQLDAAEQLIRKLDIEDLTETRSIHLHYANADRIADRIEELLSSGRREKNERPSRATDRVVPEALLSTPAGIDPAAAIDFEAAMIREEARALGIRGTVIADRGTILITHTPAMLDRLESFIRQLDTGLTFHTYQFQHLDLTTTDLFDALSDQIHDGGEAFIINATLGEVLLITSPERAGQLIHWMRQRDIAPRQVQIQAHIVRVTRDRDRDLGVTIRQAFTRSGEPPSPTIDLLFPPDIPDSPKGRIQVGTLENDNFEIILEALETEANGSLLNTPRLAVLDRETARIQVAVDQPFVESLSDANSDVTRQSTRFIPVGVTLEVIPFIDNADEVTLEVRVEVSSLQGTAANGAPIVDRTEAVSKIRVRDRHTLAIGGLIAWETLETKNKVPFLGDIPVLGHAFKNSHSELSESELIVFITPHIVGTGDSAAPPAKLEISARQPAHG